MKPIGRPSGTEPGPSVARSPETEATRARIQSCESTRLEDIIGVAPVATVVTSGGLAADSHAAVTADQRSADQLTADQLTTQLQQAVVATQSLAALQSSVASALVSTAQADFVGWFQPAGERIGEDSQLTAWQGSEIAAAEVDSLCDAALANGATVRQSHNSSTLSAVPVHATHACLVVRQPTAAATQFAGCLAYVAAVLAERQGVARRESAERAAQQSAALVELLSLVTSQSGERQGQQRLVDELQRHLQADTVILGTLDEAQHVCRLRAVSGTPECDRQSPQTQQLEAVLQESIARGEASHWPAPAADQRYALLAHEQLASDRGFETVLAVPLRSETGDTVGSLVVGFTAAAAGLANVAEHRNFLQAASRAIGTTVAALRRTHQSAVSRFWQQCRRQLRGNTGVAALVAVTVLAACALVPMDYRVKCDAQLQPVSRRYVAAPFAASLQTCLVDPGDVVQANQTLAQLDGREVRWELAGLQADMKKAEKEHSAHLSRQAFGEAAVARHEVERLRNRSALLTDRQQHLEIRSPIAGVVVTGDLRDREGVPLEMGQSLFEIAPLDQLVIEVGIPEDDIPYVQQGMTIRLRLHAVPATPIEATIVRIHPRAELRDNDNVFVAEAVIDNSAQTLRPGMKGAALVSTGRRPLGWNLLHKPIAHAAGWLGW